MAETGDLSESNVIGAIPASDVRLAKVLELWRANSATLGFLPEGAFLEHARRGYLLTAFTRSDELIGYLLYRVTNVVAIIAHLCVDVRFRGQGAARSLVGALRVATVDCTGIRASCRADFEANEMWPHLGFSVVAERPAKEEGRILKTWWSDYGKPDLLSAAARVSPIAVLDTNVFSDLLDPSREESQEAQTLLAGWFQEVVQLAIVPELYNEIDRRKKAQERSRARRYAGRFLLLRPAPSDVDSWKSRLATCLKLAKSRSDASDRRQLAGAISGGARFFVTRDTRLLRRASGVFAESGVQIVRPSEIVSMSDEELNAAAYQPVRLAGVRMDLRRVRGEEVPKFAATFVARRAGERERTLLRRLNKAIAATGSAEVWSIEDDHGESLALISLSHTEAATLSVDLLRVRSGTIEPTLARHIGWHAIRESVRLGRSRVEVKDEWIAPRVKESLLHLPFQVVGDQLLKRNASGLMSVGEMERLVGSEETHYEAGYAGAGDLQGTSSAAARRQLALESALWPAKVRGGAMPSYLVPIRPGWAMNLFDEALSAADLFGAEPMLLLQTENVYYRSSRPPIPEAPSRVVWYISQAGGVPRSKHVVGCSLVTNSVLAAAKEVFRRFHRLGAFKWPDVLRVAGGVPSAQIMAFTFEQTDLFDKPVSWQTLKVLLREYGLGGTTLQGPVRIPVELFAELYERGHS